MTEIMTLEEYIEHLQYFCNLYDVIDLMRTKITTTKVLEEIEIYKQLILWLQELKRYRDESHNSSNNTNKGDLC